MIGRATWQGRMAVDASRSLVGRLVNLLVSELDLDRPTAEQQRVVVRLEDLAEDVRRSVAEYRGGDGAHAPQRPAGVPPRAA